MRVQCSWKPEEGTRVPSLELWWLQTALAWSWEANSVLLKEQLGLTSPSPSPNFKHLLLFSVENRQGDEGRLAGWWVVLLGEFCLGFLKTGSTR